MKRHGKIEDILIYNPADKENNSVRRISNNEVVLTTYNAVQKSFLEPDPETMAELREAARCEDLSMAEVLERWINNKKKAGYLHKIHWYRVSL